jgi:hypothetical protein
MQELEGKEDKDRKVNDAVTKYLKDILLKVREHTGE